MGGQGTKVKGQTKKKKGKKVNEEEMGKQVRKEILKLL